MMNTDNNPTLRDFIIAGFHIRMSFLETDSNHIRESFISMIDTSLGDFISVSKGNHKPDFHIKVQRTDTYIFFNHDKEGFAKIFHKQKKQSTLVTFYSISADQLQMLLMHILVYLLKNVGFILHCSAVDVEGNAVIFVGKRGAGKSTTAKGLSPYYKVIADDNAIIKKEGKKYYLYQAPNTEKNPVGIKTPKRYRIQSFNFLKKSLTYGMVKIWDKESILHKMTTQVLGDTDNLKDKIGFIFELVGTFTKFYTLSLGKDGERVRQTIQDEQH